MKLLFVRHADPDYANDSLTPAGRLEAQALADRLIHEDITEFYVSPLGRAKETASYTLNRLNRTATEYRWLQEFPARAARPDLHGRRSVAWDWLPEDWTADPAFIDPDHWYDHPVMQEAHVKEIYDEAGEAFFQLLAEHGYVHENNLYRVEKENHDTLCFFCHFGIEAALLSHLFHMSPMYLWHNFVALPSSVTLVISEERQQGKASFRTSYFGDLSHLYAKGLFPSFSARFCECWSDDTRHV